MNAGDRLRRDVAALCAILAVALFVRVYPAWSGVFEPDGVNFLETDAWYHVRLIENQVRNWPWRVTLDPYAAPGGQFVPIAPFFDTFTATVALVTHGRDANAAEIERIAAFVPPALGALTVIGVWALARHAFGSGAALVAAGLLAVLPGHFLDRTMLGFYDHHALEACLAIATLWAIATARWIVAGVTLGLYLLGWSSGAFLVAVIGAWVVSIVFLDRRAAAEGARVVLSASLVALPMVLFFQDPRMYRYNTQVIGLAGLAGLSASVRAIGLHAGAARSRMVKVQYVVGVAFIAAALALVFRGGALAQIAIDVGRLQPDPSRMGVLEARPLFLYPGTWSWRQPWDFFRTGFVIGVVGLAAFAWEVWRARRPVDLLIWLFAAAMLVATIGQNRFGYYLVPGCALVGGWMASRILAWRVDAGLVAIAWMIAPNLWPSVLLAPHAGTFTPYWRNAMGWLREHTPPPFVASANAGGDDYYYARYSRGAAPRPDYSVMNWWDHGYWIIQAARRVPVANPTQERATNSARFYAATDEPTALAVLDREGSRYVLSDWELPFRIANGAIMGRFQNVLDWAGGNHAAYYEVFYRRTGDSWTAVWVFKEPYYRSMAYRLSVLGGAAAAPANATTVLNVSDRVDPGGMRFVEVLSEQTYATYEGAREAAKSGPSGGRTIVAGLDPWRPAFPLAAITSLREVHASRTPEQQPREAPWVRIFERATPREGPASDPSSPPAARAPTTLQAASR